MPTATAFNNLITFSRASQAMLTSSLGYLTYAPNNLLTYSEQFDNSAWGKSAATVTPNAATAPDGTTTADKLVESSDASPTLHIINRSGLITTAGNYTLSIYAKAAERSQLAIQFGANVTYFNLTLGTVVSGTGIITAAGSGWYRCSITATIALTNTTIAYYTAVGGTATYTGDGTSGVYLWGAQLEAVTYQTAPGTYNPTSVKNMLGYSEDFTNSTWVKFASSIAPNAAANPINGAVNAQKLIEDTTSNAHYPAPSVALTLTDNAIYTQSIYAKAAERSYIYFSIRRKDSTFAVALFNLLTGAVTNTSNTLSTSAIYVGNGWWRCSMTFNAMTGSGNPFPGYLLHNGSTVTYTGDGNSGVYIYGAQLSDSGSLDPYVPTPAAAPSATAAYYGPRFDYDPITFQPRGLLIEEQRTNLLRYSEQFDNAAWVKTRVSITANATTSPDGTVDADKLVEDTSTNTHIVSVTTTLGSAVYTYSIYAKAAERSIIRMRDSINGVDGYFDLANGTTLSGTATSRSITAVGNGWYRCVMTSNAAITNPEFGVRPAVAGPTDSYTGNGTSGIFVWGAQLEAGAFATSYIPTVASTVTRSADNCFITGSLFNQWYTQQQGTVVVQASSFGGAAGLYPSLFRLGTGSNRVDSFFSGTTTLSHETRVATVTQAAGSASVTQTNINKTARAFAPGNSSFALNGATAVSMSGGTGLIPTVSALYVGCTEVSNLNFLNGWIRSLQYYPYRLSDSQLQALTV